MTFALGIAIDKLASLMNGQDWTNRRVASWWCIGLGILVSLGCQTPAPATRSPLPARHNLHRDRITLYRDSLLPTDQTMVDSLAHLRRQIEQTLQLPDNQTSVHIFIFPDEASQRTYLASRYPQLPQRRALFLQADGHLKVFAHQSEHLAEDLRHEVTHATLHAAIDKVPLWLDEGLAEYYELPPGQRGFHPQHAQALAAAKASGRWQPDIGRLESLHDVASMTQLDYAESWLWVHWLMQRSSGQRDLMRQCLGVHESRPPIDSLWQALPQHQTPNELLATLPSPTRR